MMHKSKGAGAILHSPLVYQGWKFPNVKLVDSDLSLLEDIEIKINMANKRIFFLLYDTLIDFPPEVLLQRSSLVMSLVTIVGKALLPINDVENGLTLSPIDALNYLLEVFHKSFTAYGKYIDGNLCSSHLHFTKLKKPQPSLTNSLDALLSTTRKSRAQNATHDRIAQAELFISQRYPTEYRYHSIMGRNGPQQFDEANCDNSNILSGTVNHNRFSTHALLTTKIKYEKAPQMSVSGFAFAVVAASIPLLRLQDVEYTSNVLKVVRCMIPFILEPEELIQFQYDQMQLSTRTKNDFEVLGLQSELPDANKEYIRARAEGRDPNTLNCSRLRHLLNRVDQFLVEFGGISYIHCLKMNSGAHADNNDMPYTTDRLSDSEKINQHHHDTGFIQIILGIVSICPIEFIKSKALTTSDESNENYLLISSNLLELLKLVSIMNEFNDSPYYIFQKQILLLLNTLDNSFSSQLKLIHDIQLRFETIERLVLQPSQDYYAKLSDRIHNYVQSMEYIVPLFLSHSEVENESWTFIRNQIKESSIISSLPIILGAATWLNESSPHAEYSDAVSKLLNMCVVMFQVKDIYFSMAICQGLLALMTFQQDCNWQLDCTGKSVAYPLIRAYFQNYYRDSQSGQNVEELIIDLTQQCSITPNSLRYQLMSSFKIDFAEFTSQQMLNSLAQPNFVYLLIQHCVLGHTENSNSQETQSLKCMVICLLEVISNHILGNKHEVDAICEKRIIAHKWFSILHVLKSVLWSLSDNLIIEETFPKSLFRLANTLEVWCVKSQDVDHLNAYCRIQLQGLFHSSNSIRDLSMQKLVMLLPVQSSVSKITKSIKVNNWFNQMVWKKLWTKTWLPDIDPSKEQDLETLFRQIKSEIQLERKFKESRHSENYDTLKDCVDRTIFVRTVAYSDLKNLVCLGLDPPRSSVANSMTFPSNFQAYITKAMANNEWTDDDYRIKIAALSESRFALSDQNIVANASIEWCGEILVKCLSIIKISIQIIFDQNHVPSSEPTPLLIIFKPNHLLFLIEILAMVKLLLMSIPTLRHSTKCIVSDVEIVRHFQSNDSVSFPSQYCDLTVHTRRKQSEVDYVNIETIFEFLLVLFQSSEYEHNDQKMVNAIAELQHLSLSILFMHSFESRNWKFDDMVEITAGSNALLFRSSYESVSNKWQNQLHNVGNFSIPRHIIHSKCFWYLKDETKFDASDKQLLQSYSEDILRLKIVEGYLQTSVLFDKIIHTTGKLISFNNAEMLKHAFVASKSVAMRTRDMRDDVITMIEAVTSAKTHRDFTSALAVIKSAIITHPLNSSFHVYLLECEFVSAIKIVLHNSPKAVLDYRIAIQVMDLLLTFFTSISCDSSNRQCQGDDRKWIERLKTSVAFESMLLDIFLCLLDHHYSVLTYTSLIDHMAKMKLNSKAELEDLTFLLNDDFANLEKESLFLHLKLQYHLMLLLSYLLKNDYWKARGHSLLIKEQSLIHFLSIVTNNEYYPICIRSFSCDLIYSIMNIHSNEGTYFLITNQYTDMDPVLSLASSSSFFIPAKLRNKQLVCRPIDFVLFFIRVSRRPDSFRFSCPIITCLKIVLKCLYIDYLRLTQSEKGGASCQSLFDHHAELCKIKHQFNSGEVDNCPEVSKSKLLSNHSNMWKWLLRMCFDRNNIVKLLSFECYRLLLKIHPDMNTDLIINAGAMRQSEPYKKSKESHSDGHDPGSNSKAENTTQVEPGDSDSHIVWGLHHHIRQVIADCTECPLVRTAGLALLLDRFTHLSTTSKDNTLSSSTIEDEKSAIIATFFAALLPCLNTFTQVDCDYDELNISFRELNQLLSNLFDLIQIDRSGEILDKLHNLKMIPKLLAFLRTNMWSNFMIDNSGSKLGFLQIALLDQPQPKMKQPASYSTLFRSKMGLGHINAATGWNSSIAEVFQMQMSELVHVQYQIIKLILQVNSVDQDAFQQILKRSALVHYLFDSSFLSTYCRSRPSLDCNHWSALNDTLGFIIQYDSKASIESISQMVDPTSHFFENKSDLQILSKSTSSNLPETILSVVSDQLQYVNQSTLTDVDFFPILRSSIRLVLSTFKSKYLSSELTQSDGNQNLVKLIKSTFSSYLTIYLNAISKSGDNATLNYQSQLLQLEMIIISFMKLNKDCVAIYSKILYLNQESQRITLIQLLSDQLIALNTSVNQLASNLSSSIVDTCVRTGNRTISPNINAATRNAKSSPKLLSSTTLEIVRSKTSKINCSSGLRKLPIEATLKLSANLSSNMLADTNAALPVQGAGIFGRKKSENMYEMSGVDRLKMWRLIHILEFLTSIQGKIEIASCIPDEKYRILFSLLLEPFQVWSCSKNYEFNISSAQIQSTNESTWIPSYKDICNATLSYMTSFANLSPKFCRLLATCCEVRLSASIHETTGNIIHLLLPIAVSPPTNNSTIQRKLTLLLLSKLFQTDSVSSAQKHAVELLLQGILYKNIKSLTCDKSTFLSLFHAWTSSILNQTSFNSNSLDALYSVFNLVDASEYKAIEKIPTPDMLRLIYSKFGDSVRIVILIVKFVGQMLLLSSNKRLEPNPPPTDSDDVQIENVNHNMNVAYAAAIASADSNYTRKLTMTATSESCIHLLLEIFFQAFARINISTVSTCNDQNEYIEIVYLSCRVLVLTMNHTEQAKAIVKQSVYIDQVYEVLSQIPAHALPTLSENEFVDDHSKDNGAVYGGSSLKGGKSGKHAPELKIGVNSATELWKAKLSSCFTNMKTILL